MPSEYVNFLTTHLRFHYLEEAGTSLDTLDRSRFNIIVSNTQTIILKRQHKEKTPAAKLFGAPGETLTATGVYADAADLYNFDQPEEEGELTTNQRFEKLGRLEQHGIYVDEAHHAFGKALAKDMGVGAKGTDTSLRTTIDKAIKYRHDFAKHITSPIRVVLIGGRLSPDFPKENREPNVDSRLFSQVIASARRQVEWLLRAEQC